MRKRFGAQFGLRAMSIATTVITVLSLASAVSAKASASDKPGVAAMALAPKTHAHPEGTRSANSGSQEQCFFQVPSCASFSPAVSFGFISNGDTSGCSFAIAITWGDGKSSTATLSGAANGLPIGNVSHTYANKPGTYPIAWTSTASGSNCSNTSGSLTFLLLSPLTDGEQGAAANPTEKDTNCDGADPVNCASGVFWDTFTDISVPGRGLPLDLTRTYESSRAGTSGRFGSGWTDSYAMSLSTGASGNVTITQENGSTVSFSPDGSGGFVPPPRVEATLAKNGDGSYTFTRFQGEATYGFSAAGRLTSESDLNGYLTRLAYTPAGRLTSVTDPAGRKLSFTYSGSHIATARDPLGRTYRYGYSATGNLVKVTDPLGRSWSFTYDGKHRLVALTDPRGGKTANTYNASGRVTAQVDPDGGKTTWSYSGNPATLAGGSTTMTDPNGIKTTFRYSDLEMLSVTVGVGTASAATTSYTYDPSTLGVVSRTDPDGNTTTSTYDTNGNLLTSTDPLGGTTTYTYNGLNEVTTETDPLGNFTSDNYGGGGNLISVTDPQGNATSYQYSTVHPGDVTSVTDPDGHVTSYRYDRDGDVATASVAPSGSVTDTTAYSYDTDGERYCVIRPVSVAAGVKCPAAGGGARPGLTLTRFDGDGETTSVTDPDGHVTRYAYNGDGEQASMTSAAGQVTSYAYNGDGRLTKETRPGKTVLANGYDLDGNITRQLNAAGQATKYTYSPLALMTSTTDPLGHVTRYGYDKAGHRTKLTDAQGRVTSYSYDKDGRLTGVSYSDGKTHAVAYAYDADGRRTSMTDATGTTTYSYDADSRTTSVTSGVSGTVSYGFDPAGLLTTLTYPSGQSVTRGFDGAGELTSVRDWLGNTTTFGYDRDGNLTSQAYPNGVSERPAFDKADLLTSVTDKRGSTTLASFKYGRNSLGELTSDAESGAAPAKQSYSYTRLNQLASSSAGKFGYDAAGDLTAQPGGEKQTFNADGQLTSAAKAKYAYDKAGDLVTAGSRTFRYDQAGELTGFGKTATYSYNGDGLRLAKSVKGTTTTFAWDASGGTPLVIAAGSTSYVYGPGGQPIEQVTGTTPAFLLGDQSGSTRLITSAAGAVTGTYTYGPYGTVAKHTGTATTALQYDGQYTDAETGYQYLRARYYDPSTGQFLTRDPLVSFTGSPYGYAIGNPLNNADPTGLCPKKSCADLLNLINEQTAKIQGKANDMINNTTLPWFGPKDSVESHLPPFRGYQKYLRNLIGQFTDGNCGDVPEDALDQATRPDPVTLPPAPEPGTSNFDWQPVRNGLIIVGAVIVIGGLIFLTGGTGAVAVFAL
jgi:RHS repeat-associated protein